MSVPKRRLLAAILGLAVVLAFSLSKWLSSRPAPRYTVTDLGVLPGYAESSASGINSRGDVVGVILPQPSRMFQKHIFFYRSGRMTDLGLSSLLGGPAINDRGEVTGNVTLNGQNGRPFLYSAAQMRDLGNLPGCSMGFGNSMNNQGQIAGGEIGLNAS